LIKLLNFYTPNSHKIPHILRFQSKNTGWARKKNISRRGEIWTMGGSWCENHFSKFNSGLELPLIFLKTSMNDQSTFWMKSVGFLSSFSPSLS